jgi:hypothetical protein
MMDEPSVTVGTVAKGGGDYDDSYGPSLAHR